MSRFRWSARGGSGTQVFIPAYTEECRMLEDDTDIYLPGGETKDYHEENLAQIDLPEIAVSADSADGTEPIGDPPDFGQDAADIDNGGDYGAQQLATVKAGFVPLCSVYSKSMVKYGKPELDKDSGYIDQTGGTPVKDRKGSVAYLYRYICELVAS